MLAIWSLVPLPFLNQGLLIPPKSHSLISPPVLSKRSLCVFIWKVSISWWELQVFKLHIITRKLKFYHWPTNTVSCSPCSTYFVHFQETICQAPKTESPQLVSDIVLLSSRSVAPANKWQIQLVNQTLREEHSCFQSAAETLECTCRGTTREI